MRPSPARLSVAAALASLLVASLAPPAHAALGEPALSVAADQTRLQAGLRAVNAGALYSTHELQTSAGTTVREFVTPGGVVFAVSWHGPFKPDLRQLLGRSYDLYAQAPRTPGSARAGLSLDSKALVLRSGGRMRAFAGVAYLPALMPAGVTAGDLQ